MTPPDGTRHLAPLRRLYADARIEGADDAQRVGWDSVAVQRVRFEALLEAVADGDWAPSTRLLDVGCGFGALVDWLHATGRRVDYHGIDVLPEMIDEARRRHPDARFEVADLFAFEADAPYDVVVCSGALSLRFGDDDEAEERSWRFIERLYALSSHVCAFNVQSSRGLDEATRDLRSDFWYVAPEELLARLQPLCRDVVVREDIVPSDAIVYLYRDYCRTTRRLVDAGRLSALDAAELHVQRDEPRRALALLGDQEGDGARHALLRGVAHARLGDADAARDALAYALELAPDDPECRRSAVALAIAREALDDVFALVDEMPRGGSLALRRDEIRMLAHEALVGAGQGPRADALEAAAETAFGAAMLAAGRAIAETRWGDAIGHGRAALDARPGDGRPRVLLAIALQRAGEDVEALHHCAAVLSAAPGHELARTVSLHAMRRLARVAAGPDSERAAAARHGLDDLTGHDVLGPVARRLIGGLSTPG